MARLRSATLPGKRDAPGRAGQLATRWSEDRGARSAAEHVHLDHAGEEPSPRDTQVPARGVAGRIRTDLRDGLLLDRGRDLPEARVRGVHAVKSGRAHQSPRPQDCKSAHEVHPRDHRLTWAQLLPIGVRAMSRAAHLQAGRAVGRKKHSACQRTPRESNTRPDRRTQDAIDKCRPPSALALGARTGMW